MTDSLISVTSAAPFQPPRVAYHEAGLSLADIVAAAFADGRLDPAWEETLTIHVGDRQWPRELWATTRPKPGAIVALRGHARDLVSIAVNLAIAFTVSAIVSAFTPKPKALSQEDPLFSIDSARNEVALYQSWPAVLGKHRIFPPHASKHFTQVENDKVYLYVLLGLGLAPYTLDASSIKIGDTLASSYPGFQYQTKLSSSDGWPSLFPARSPDEQEGPGAIAQEDGWVSLVTDADDASRIECELSWPAGLVRIRSNGETDSVTVSYAARYRPVGGGTWYTPGGVPTTDGEIFTLTLRTRKPFRKTIPSNTSPGQYEWQVRRVTEDYDNPNIITQFEWSKLRTFTNEAPVVDDDLALLAVKLEAGPQLNSVIDQINCVVTRVAPVWDSEGESWGTPGATQNPAALARWVATGPGTVLPYGANEIDDAAFGLWHNVCTFFGWRCDMELRPGANQSLDDVLQNVARCGRATLTIQEGKLTPILDYIQPAATQLFTPRNSWGMRARRRYPPNAHAYRVEFNNEAKGYVRDEIVVPFTGYTEETAELIPTLQAVGKTRSEEVWHEGWRVIAETIIRGMDYSWRADWESLAAARGRRVAFAHWEVGVGIRSARVRSLVLNAAQTHVVALELDEKVTQTLGVDYAIEWRTVSDDTGSGDPGFVVSTLGVTTTSGTSRRVELSASGGVALASAPVVGDLVTFGEADIQVLDLVVTDIQRSSAFEAEISAVAYADLLFDGDQAEEPEWESNVTGEVFPAPPTPVVTAINATPNGIYVQFEFPTATASRVLGVEGYSRDANDDDPRFELIWADDGAARLAIFPAGEFGSSFEIKLVSVGARGRRAESAAFTVASATPDPNPSVLNFTPIATENATIAGASITKVDPPAIIAITFDEGDEIDFDDGGSIDWDSEGWTDSVYSAESYTNGAVAIAIAYTADKEMMFGLSTAPASIHPKSIDFAWRLGADGKARVYEGDVLAWDNGGSPENYTLNDVFSVSYDGAYVRYYQSGVLKYERAAVPDLALFFDCALYDAGASIDGVAFNALATAAQVTETRYKRSIAPPATPTGAQPSDWSIAIPPGTIALWATTATKTAAGSLVGEWSLPVLLTSPNWRFEYNPATEYYREDGVNYAGGSYKLKVASSTGNAPSGTAQANAYWDVWSPPPAALPAEPSAGFTATIDISSSSVGVNLRTLADAAGYDGFSDATIIFEVENGVSIVGLAGAGGGNDPIGIGGGIAVDTGYWPTATYSIDLTLRVKSGGVVRGGGGGGGRGSVGQTSGYQGGAGGDAVYCRTPIDIIVDSGGAITGGGGGGGGGGGLSVSLPTARRGGGGGGGGYPNGGGGSEGRGDDDSTSGASGTTGGGGAGGNPGTSGSRSAGGGGAGGGAGSVGSNGQATINPANQYAGGSAGTNGYSIRFNGYAVGISNSGTILGNYG